MIVKQARVINLLNSTHGSLKRRHRSFVALSSSLYVYERASVIRRQHTQATQMKGGTEK